MRIKILEIISETEKINSFRLQKPEGFQFLPGQHVEVEPKEGLEHDLTISASPTEPFLQFTTMYHAESEFKNILWKMKSGEEVEITEARGRFSPEETDLKEKIFMAGGIGITPFRSMLKYMADKQLTVPVTLLYSVEICEEAAFAEELEKFKSQIQNFKLQIIETSKTGRLDGEKIQTYCPGWKESEWWACGPAGFVDAMIGIGKEIGLPPEQIRSEDFPGY